MKTTIYMIRHGQSVANAARVFIGQTDLDLTERGHAQAELTADFLNDVKVDAIYASTLMRAFHTAEHTALRKGITVTPSLGLREIDAGEWENRPVTELRERYAEAFGIWTEDVGHSAPTGGESVLALQERCVAEVERIAKLHEGQTVCCFTHATPIRTVAAKWMGYTAETMKDLPWPTNASVSILEYENGVFRVADYSIDHFQGDLVCPIMK